MAPTFLGGAGTFLGGADVPRWRRTVPGGAGRFLGGAGLIRLSGRPDRASRPASSGFGEDKRLGGQGGLGQRLAQDSGGFGGPVREAGDLGGSALVGGGAGDEV